MSFVLKTIIEIPKNNNVKYEIVNNKLTIDRIMLKGFNYPENYGFFPNTLDYDGDPLDSLIIADASFLPFAEIEVRVLGAMKMIDDGETDTKLIAVVNNDPNYHNVNSLEDLDEKILAKIKTFFETYKKHKAVEVKIEGFEDASYAKEQYQETAKLFQKYHKLEKKAFIAKMKEIHPEKYQ